MELYERIQHLEKAIDNHDLHNDGSEEWHQEKYDLLIELQELVAWQIFIEKD